MDRFVYILFRAVCRAISLMPILAVYRLGTALGALAHWVLVPYRRLAVANMTLAFGEEKTPREIRRLAREHFARMGANFLCSIKLSQMTKEEVPRRIEVEGAEWINRTLAEGKGAVFIAAHLGNWEALAQMAPFLFPSKMGAVYQRLGNRHIDAYIRRVRSRLGTKVFDRKSELLAAGQLVREGGSVGVLVDQHAGDGGIWTPFFGRLASTSPLAAMLAVHTGAPILRIAVYTVRPGHWKIVIEKQRLSGSDDPAVITAEINQSVEELIRRSPADWFWVHNRWKTPNPNFLLARYRRGVVFPPGFDRARLKPFKIVVRSSNWLGDAVMTTPAVRAIKRGRPDAHVAVLVKAKLADYWRRIPEVDEVVPIEPSDSVWSVARKLRGKFEAAVVLPNSIRSALEPWLAGIPRRAGYPGRWRRKLLNQPYEAPRRKSAKPRPAEHQVYHYLRLAQWMGAGAENQVPPDAFFPARPPAPGAPVKIGLCPGAEYGPAKRWPPERFAAVANAVSAARGDVEWVLFGVAADAGAGGEISRQIAGRQTNLIGRTTLSELMDRLSECALLLTNDTGTMHLAAALGVRTVAVFGSTEPRLTGPLGPGHRVLRHQVECSPCFLRECPLDFRCMKAVTVEETARAVLESLEF